MKSKLLLLVAGVMLLAGVAIATTQSSPAEVETQVLDAAQGTENAQQPQTGDDAAAPVADAADEASPSPLQVTAASGVVVVTDARDGAIPPQAPEGFETGWDIQDLQFTYDAEADELLVVFRSFGVIGDPEGNGDPSAWAPEWDAAGLPGVDEPNLGGLEHAVVTFDLDQDGQGDLIAGVPQGADISAFSINSLTPGFDPVPFIGFAFGAPLPNNTGTIPTAAPDANNPDISFTITNFSTVVAGDDSLNFGVNAFLGSGSDGNIGEDTLTCLLYTSPSPRDLSTSRMPSSA